ncbi:hypothetical protein QQX13_08280 [Demequina sp. SYSU T00068]|uniref:hypothetical protein n=1 Tax=Demequina lignilytica TaxID=3051663 RepID=UPI00261EB8CD|nr:hypothetical protein [Demequina sp. SYSU T00068]MDN4490828.1 hypothetical protein [Demequina sp. SYSU T00068]
MQAATSVMPTTLGSSPLPSRLRDSRWWWVLAAASVAMLLLAMYVVSRSAIAPRTPWDENGVLELARVFAGQDDVPLMITRGYYPLASIVIAPIWWFTSDAATVYAWANLVSNVVGFATILPLIGLARRMGLSTPQAILASAVTLTLPAYTGLADYVLAEQFVGFLLVLAAYLAYRYWERPTFGRAGLLALALLAGVFTHPRMIVGIGVAAIWLAGLLVSRTHRLTAGVTLAVLVPASLLVNRAAKALAELVLWGDFSQGGALQRSLSDLDPVLIMKIAFSQTWAQLVGTLGLVAFGAVVVAVWAGREVLTERRFGPGVFILGLSLAGCLVSILNWSNLGAHFYNAEPRLDSWLYTRYIAPFVLVVILAGIAALLRRMSLAMIGIAVGSTVVVVAGMLTVFADSIPTWGSTYGPGNVAALRAWEGMWPTEPHAIPLTPTLTGPNRFWVIASLVVLAAQAVTVVLSRWPRVLAGALVVGAAWYAHLSDPSLARELPDRIESGIDRVETVSDGLVAIDVDIDCGASIAGRDTTANWVGYWLSPRQVDLVGDEEAFAADVVIACDDWDLAADLGALNVPDSSNYGYSVWVPAGGLQDNLVDAGVLARP